MSSESNEQQAIHAHNHTLPDVCIVLSENQPLLPPPSPTTSNMDLIDDPHLPPWNTNITDDPEYADIIKQAERAIEGGVLPVRIAAGSSGSYFVRNLEGVRTCALATRKSPALSIPRRKPSEYSNRKTKNRTVDSIQNGPNGELSRLLQERAILVFLGYRKRSALAASDVVASFLTKATCPRLVLVSSIQNFA